MFSPELRAHAEEIVDRYPVGRSALLPLLHLVQAADGRITDDGVAECAELLGLTKAEVNAVATFYTMYKRTDLGRHLVSVCTNFSCKVRGGQEVYERLSDHLGVGMNETTADGAITLEHAECLGNCEGAPVVTVDYLNYECVEPDAAVELVEHVRAGEVPPPTRGMTPPGIRDVQWRLAGLGPAQEGGPGHASNQARSTDGAVPPATAGPGFAPIPVTPEFSPEREAERAAAKASVTAAGQDPDAVESQAGSQAREFPTTDADWEPRRPEGSGGHRPPGEDRDRAPAGNADEVQPEFRSEAGEGDLGAGEDAPETLGAESGAGGGHDYPPESGSGSESVEGEEPQRPPNPSEEPQVPHGRDPGRDTPEDPATRREPPTPGAAERATDREGAGEEEQ